MFRQWLKFSLCYFLLVLNWHVAFGWGNTSYIEALQVIYHFLWASVKRTQSGSVLYTSCCIKALPIKIWEDHASYFHMVCALLDYVVLNVSPCHIEMKWFFTLKHPYMDIIFSPNIYISNKRVRSSGHTGELLPPVQKEVHCLLTKDTFFTTWINREAADSDWHFIVTLIASQPNWSHRLSVIGWSNFKETNRNNCILTNL